MNFISWFSHGVFDLPWWGYGVIALSLTHITILAVTIFLHRAQAHRALTLHPLPSHFFRLWLWLTTGIITKEWAAIHRKHHAFADKPGDPHSPQIYGIKKVLREGAELYQQEARNRATVNKYGNGTPDDWLERNIYSAHNSLGLGLMLCINLTLFGAIGLSIWALQMLWIPLFAAGIINGLGHWLGYRNFENPDQARNIVPWGILIGGEELHNNHHTFATSAKLSVKWYELDLGWLWIQILVACGLAKVKKSLPRIQSRKLAVADGETLEVIIANRYSLVVALAKSLKQECQVEIARLKLSLMKNTSWCKLKTLLIKDRELLSLSEEKTILAVTTASPRLQKIFSLRQELSQLWARYNLSREELLSALQTWCHNAETSGIESLRTFALNLRQVQVFPR